MKMQSILFSMIAAALLATAMPATAQKAPRDPEARIDRRIEQMDERLDLTEAQESEIRRILAEHAAEMEPRRREMRAHREGLDAAIKDVLTPEQREIYGKARDERIGRMGARMDHMARMAEELNLSEDQKERLKVLHQAHRETMQNWREANPEATAEERKAFFETQREAMHESLQSVLSSDQLRKLEQMHAQRGKRGEGRGMRGHGGRH